jgi:hypothetical protein
VRFTRPLAVAAIAVAALSAVPAQASSTDVLSYVCGPDTRSSAAQCDVFWLFRPCGPLVACP